MHTTLLQIEKLALAPRSTVPLQHCRRPDRGKIVTPLPVTGQIALSRASLDT